MFQLSFVIRTHVSQKSTQTPVFSSGLFHHLCKLEHSLTSTSAIGRTNVAWLSVDLYPLILLLTQAMSEPFSLFGATVRVLSLASTKVEPRLF